MTNRKSRMSGKSLKFSSPFAKKRDDDSRNNSRARQHIFRGLLVESLERREMMASDVVAPLQGEGEAAALASSTAAVDLRPRLLSVAPNSGQILDSTPSGTPNLTALNLQSESPTELVFRFDGAQQLDPNTLTGIRIMRAGGDGKFDGTNDAVVTPGFLGFGENQRIVIARFSSPLPDDLYRIEILAEDRNGLPAIRNTSGDALQPQTAGTDRDTYYFNVELGVQVVAVVPQPTTSNSNGVVSRSANLIEVDFSSNDDKLNLPATSTDIATRSLFQLIKTNDTVTPNDDVVILPTQVNYDATQNRVGLVFAQSLDAAGAATYRLRIGTQKLAPSAASPAVPINIDLTANNPGGNTSNASNAIGTINGAYSAVITQEIRTVDNADKVLNNYPGGPQDPGERDIQDESHLAIGATADSNPEITKRYYSFLDNTPYGTDSQGRPVTTAISDIQKQRVREVFEFYSDYLGIDFVETTGLSGPDGSVALQVVVGDLLGPVIGTSGPEGYVSFVTKALNDNPLNNTLNLGILDGSESWDNDFGFGTQPDKDIVQLMADWRLGSVYTQILDNPPDTDGPNFFVEAMRVIGSLLGLGQSNDLPPGTIQGFDPLLGRPANPLEQIFPGDNDIVDGQFLYRPDNRDVDLYRFDVAAGQTGTFTAETIAERLMNSSTLDTHLTLLRQYTDNFGRSRTEIVATNDDYFSEDSLIRLHLEAGTYYVAVTAKGNQDFDPDIAGSGSGGTSQGKYQLRIDFRPDQPDTQTLRDTAGTSLDGDGDGLEGGTFDFWFRAAAPAGTEAAGAPRTLYVSKLYSGNQTGSLSQPFNTIAAALAAARPNDIVRIVGNGGSDNNFATVGDNRAYEIGNGGPVIGTLSDGANLVVPQGVTLMIDGGAIIKFGNNRILVGSNDTTTDRSGAAIQVLGTPKNRVIFTSYTDESVGVDTNPLNTTPAKGDWGGIEIRNDFDNSQGRLNRERQGAFLNYISNADFRYGGGQVAVGGTPKVVNPIDLSEARATIINNRIVNSADAAMSADPNTFEETLFTEPRYQGNAPFTPDYTRVGPVIRGNILADNTINGLFIRVDTLAGQDPKALTVTGRINETDITIVMGENLTVQGTPGGPVAETAGPNVAVSVAALTDPTAPSTGLAAGTYSYVVTFVDAFGSESLPSAVFGTIAATANKAIRLTNLPTTQGDYVGRKLYRRLANGAFQLVAELNSQQTTYVDQGATLLGTLNTAGLTFVQRARRDASLIIDPGVVVKSQGSRIEVGMGATMIAEGTDAKPIIFTSTRDDRYGKGGTFDTNGDGINVNAAAPGDWSGIVALNLSTLSLDSVVVTYGGGSSRVPGGFASFNAIEIHQAEARIADSTIENNASGAGDPGTTRRAARGVNDAAAIYVSGAQPIIINNTIRNNSEINPDLLSLVSQNGETAAISIDPNSMKATPKSDYGRSIGASDRSLADSGNLGPLVSGNKLGGNAINGMRVRGGTMTTEGAWDDTDIVHVVQKEIVVPDFHEYGGLRLQSSVGESLVVKLAGADAGFTATGRPLDITDRIGGSLQIIGAPGFPVVLTSLKDDTIGAGFDFAGRSMLDTNGDGSTSTPAPGDWRSVRLDAFSNDRNVQVTYEFESKNPLNVGFNNTVSTAQEIGSLAPNLNAGDENLRLGITVTGTIAADSDRDIYKFTGTAGTMVWLDIDRTSTDLDSVVELIDAQGRIIAQSNNSITESISKNIYFNPSFVDNDQVFPLDQSAFAQQNANSPTATDFQSTNPLDAGFRMVLPGTPGTSNDYYVRVRSSNLKPGDPTTKLQDLDAINQGLTHGSYRLQVRLQQEDEIGGSTIRLATAKYASTAIEVLGGPMHSPILGEFSESSASETATAPSSAINVGNVLEQDRAATSIAGTIGSAGDVDWYRFTVQRQLSSNLESEYHTSVVFDLDYADALGRANTSLWVYQSNNGVPGNLVLFGRDSDIADDKSAPGGGSGTGDLSRGSFGSGDAFIGAAELPPGEYMVAVTNNSLSSVVLQQYQQAQLTGEANPLTRLEPIDSIFRVSDDRDFTGSNVPDPNVADQVAFASGTANGVPYNLSDVNLYVGRDRPTNGQQSQLLFGNGMTGAKEAQGSDAVGGIFTQSRITDIAVSPGGRIVGPNVLPNAGAFGVINDNNTNGFTTVLASGGASTATNTGIQTFEASFNAGGAPQVTRAVDGAGNLNGIGMDYTAVMYAQDNNNQLAMFAVASRANRQDFDRAVLYNINNAAAFQPINGAKGNNTDYIIPAVNDETDPRYIGGFRNILYRLDPNTQAGISPPAYGNRPGLATATGTGTQVREYGVFAEVSTYTRDRFAPFDDHIVVKREATGDIVGISQIGQYIYGVTNTGELWRMDTNVNGDGWAGGFQGAVLIATNLPVGMTSLTKGPRDIAIDANKKETILNIPDQTTSGTFRLQVNGNNTAVLNYNATAAQVQSALETLLGAGNVKVTGGPAASGALSIVLTGALAGQQIPITIVNQNFQAAAGPTRSILDAGAANSFEFTVDKTSADNVTLNINGTTAAFAANAAQFSSAAAFQAALNAMGPLFTSGVDAVVVQTNPVASPVANYRVIFVGDGAAFLNLTVNPNTPPVTNPASVGNANASSLYKLGVPLDAATGTFQLRLGNQTIAQTFNITTPRATLAAQIQTALNALVAGNNGVTVLVQIAPEAIVPGDNPRIFNIVLAGPGANALGAVTVVNSSNFETPPVVTNPVLATQTITAYNQILFGAKPDGTLVAFDTNGVAQNVFPGGLSSTVTADATNGISNSAAGGTDVAGIDFGALDVNLWHTTDTRFDDAGHGTLATFNDSRDATATGGNSLYFGFRDNTINMRQQGDWTGIYDIATQIGANGANGNYNLPGGARGALQSNPLDLAGYTADDQPTLYFNYLLNDEASNSSGVDANVMRDSFRVYGLGPDNTWILLGTNNSYGDDDNDFNRLGLNRDLNEYDVPVSRNQDQYDRSFRTQELFDDAGKSGAWRQARINLSPLAGMSDAVIRFEFSTGGDFRTGDPLRAGVELIAQEGAKYKAGDTFSLQVNGATKLFQFIVGNEPLMAGATAVPINGAMSAQGVRDAIRLALAMGINGDTNTMPYPVYGNSVVVFKATVLNSGPLKTTDSFDRTGDMFGPYTGLALNPLTGQWTATKNFDRAMQATLNNSFEGVFLDDIIVGFAERGEQVFNPVAAGANIFAPTPFYEDIGGPNGVRAEQVELGAYQLEIRPGREYGFEDTGTGKIIPTAIGMFNTNDRLTNGAAIVVSKLADVADGDQFTLSDGINVATFEFDLANNGVSPGTIAVPLTLPNLNAAARSGSVARAIRNAINGTVAQSILKITAGVRGQMLDAFNQDIQQDSSNIVELYGAVASDIYGGRKFSNSPAIGSRFYGGENPIGGEANGDSNIERDQGQVIIDSNTIVDSANYGIQVSAGLQLRNDLGPNVQPRPYPGSVRNLITLNTENLVTGPVVVNNVVARSGVGAIHISGDSGPGAPTAPAIPPKFITRVINNTLFGNVTATGTGILVDGSTAPTLINNIISNFVTGLSVGTGAVVVAGGNLYKSNTTTRTGVAAGTFDIVLGDNDPLFSNTTNDRFYLASGSKAIDSSIASLQERTGLTQVKSGVQLPTSPLIAPTFDVGGLRRVDDPLVNTPVGQGSNVFIDRGAVDRSDFVGPGVTLTRPIDNDLDGVDTDASATYVKLAPTTAPVDYFELLIDERSGTGPDPDSINQDNVILTEDGRVLTPGVDYEFGYSVNSRTIRLTPLAGFWREGKVYEITINNRNRFELTAPTGDKVADGDQFTAVDSLGGKVVFEYDTGTQIQLPSQAAIFVPDAGGAPSAVKDTDRFTIIANGKTAIFELDNNQSTTAGSVAIPYLTTDTKAQLTAKIVAAIQGSTLGVTPVVLSDGRIVLNNGTDVQIDTSTSSFTQPADTLAFVTPEPTSVVDGQTFTVSDNQKTVTFEFDSDGTLATGNVGIAYSTATNSSELAALILTAINGADLFVKPVQAGNVLSLGLPPTGAVSIGNTALRVIGIDHRIVDGQTIAITEGSSTVTFEFDSNGTVGTGRIKVPFTTSQTPFEIAQSLAQVMSASNLTFDTVALSDGSVSLKATTPVVVNVGTATNLLVSGQPGVGKQSQLTVNALPADGNTFTVNNNGKSVTFEFNNDTIRNPALTQILFTNSTTPAQLALQIAAAIRSSVLALDSTVGGNVISFKDNPRTTYDFAGSPSLTLTGIAGGVISIPISRDTSTSAADMAIAIRRALQSATSGANPISTSLTARIIGGNLIMLDNATSVTGAINSLFLPGVKDLAGNFLTPNRVSNETQFTILMPGVKLDYGDAADPFDTTPGKYPTLSANGGAGHVILEDNKLWLGAGVSADADGQPSVTGNTDTFDDGVKFSSTAVFPAGFTSSALISRQLTNTITITASSTGFVDAWIDFNADGDWDDPDEQILKNVPFYSDSLTQTMTIVVPASAPQFSDPKFAFARFRISADGSTTPGGLATSGEVEDYRVTLLPNSVPPVVSQPIPDQTTNEDTVLRIPLGTYITDPDSFDKLTYTAVSSDPTKATVAIDGNDLVITPQPNKNGKVTITVKGTDLTNLSVSDAFDLTIVPVNDAPVGNVDAYTVPVNRFINTTDAKGTVTQSPADDGVLANDIDVDGDALTATLVTGPTKGTLTLRPDGTFNYKPLAGAVVGGTDTFTYQASDPSGLKSGVVTVTITFGATANSPHYNPVMPTDVDNSGVTSSIDVLSIINFLNANRGRPSIPVDELTYTPPPFRDVNNDFLISSLDVLAVVNYLNARSRGQGGEGESSSVLETSNSIIAGPMILNASGLSGSSSAEGEGASIQAMGTPAVANSDSKKSSSPTAVLDSVLADYDVDDADYSFADAAADSSVFDAAIVDLTDLPNNKK